MAGWGDFLSGLLDTSQPADYVSLIDQVPSDLGAIDWSGIANVPAPDLGGGGGIDWSSFGNVPIDYSIPTDFGQLPPNLLDLAMQGTAGGDNNLFGASPGAPGTVGMTNLDRMIQAGINPGTGQPLDQGSFWSNLLGGASKLGSGLLNLAKGLGGGAGGAGGGLGGAGAGSAPFYGPVSGQSTSADFPMVGGATTNTGAIPSLSLPDLRGVPLGGVSVPGVPGQAPQQGALGVPGLDLPALAQQAAQPILPMPAVPQRIAPTPFNPMPIAVSGAGAGGSGLDALSALLSGRGGGTASGLQRLLAERLG